jgi:hypothetical protein
MKNITLHCNVILRASGNFRRALVPLCFDLDDGPVRHVMYSGLGLFATGLKPASGTHICRGLAPCNHTMQGQLTNRIGVYRHRSTALFKYANRTREFVGCLTSPKLQNLKGDAKLLRSLERNDTRFSAPRKEGRLVNMSRIHKFKYQLATRREVVV